MEQIFICYRREDSRHAAGRIYDRLEKHFRVHGVFMDVASIAPGVDYRARLREVLGQCKAVLVVIGDRWLDVRDKAGQPRLHRPDDDVRIEIETALSLGLHVMPLRIDGVPMPHKSDLPESIASLAAIHAMVVRADPDFHRDVDLLLAKLPLDYRVNELQSFADRARPMLRRVQAGQSELERLSRENSEVLPNMISSAFRRPGPDSHREFGRLHQATEWMNKCFSVAFEHTKPYVNFAHYLDPRVGINPGNIEEVVARFRELQVEAQSDIEWAERLIPDLWYPGAPEDLARRAKSLMEDLRDQVKEIQSEAAKVTGIG